MDQALPEVTIKLDKERHLKFTLGSMIRFKKSTGKDLRDPEVIKTIRESPDIEDLVALYWSCLYWEDKTLTVEQVSDLIDLSNIKELQAKINQAFTLSTPEKEDSDPLASGPNG